MVLAKLPFTNQALDLDLKSDDGLHHFINVISWGIADCPWFVLIGFVFISEVFQQAQQPIVVFNEA